MANKAFRQMGPSIPFVAGGQSFIDIPRWGVLYEMVLRIAFTITSAGGAAPSGPKAQTLARIIRNLSLTVNGKDNIVNLPGYTLAALAYNNYKRLPVGMSAALPSAVSTAYNYVIYLPITLFLPHAVRPDDTGLNLGSPRIAGVPAQLKIDWATDVGDFFTTPASATLSNVTCEMSGLYESDPEPVFRDGPSAGKARYWMTRVMDQKLVDLTASNTAFPITIDEKTGIFYRSLTLQTFADSAYSAAVLNNGKIELRSGSDVYGSLNAGHITDVVSRHLGVDAQTGVYWWDFDLFKSAITAINTAGLPADLVLYLDATKTGTSCQIAVCREGLRNLAV